MFDRHGRQMRVGGQVARHACCVEEIEQDVGVTVARVDEGGLRTGNPRTDPVAGVADVEGGPEDPACVETRMKPRMAFQGRPTRVAPFNSASHQFRAASCRRDVASWA